jgi:hypothetical protein
MLAPGWFWLAAIHDRTWTEESRGSAEGNWGFGRKPRLSQECIRMSQIALDRVLLMVQSSKVAVGKGRYLDAVYDESRVLSIVRFLWGSPPYWDSSRVEQQVPP